MVPDAPQIQDTVALDGDGHVIAEARHRAVDFLTRVQAEHGLPVSARAMDLTQLVVSELVTNARRYAPGPVLMERRVTGAGVEVVVRDSDPVLPVATATDARAPAARRRVHRCSTSRPPANWAGSPPRSCCRAAGPRRTCATRPSTSPPRSCTTTATTA
nr:ATP-binding protein [Streptomyces massasporeus]